MIFLWFWLIFVEIFHEFGWFFATKIRNTEFKGKQKDLDPYPGQNWPDPQHCKEGSWFVCRKDVETTGATNEAEDSTDLGSLKLRKPPVSRSTETKQITLDSLHYETTEDANVFMKYISETRWNNSFWLSDSIINFYNLHGLVFWREKSDFYVRMKKIY